MSERNWCSKKSHVFSPENTWEGVSAHCACGQTQNPAYPEEGLDRALLLFLIGLFFVVVAFGLIARIDTPCLECPSPSSAADRAGSTHDDP